MRDLKYNIVLAFFILLLIGCTVLVVKNNSKPSVNVDMNAKVDSLKINVGTKNKDKN